MGTDRIRCGGLWLLVTLVLAACGGGGGGSAGPVEVPPPTAPVPITLSLATGASWVPAGDSVTVSWVTTNGATGCTASGDWSGRRPAVGKETVGPLTNDMSFTLQCEGPAGTTPVHATVTAVVTPATAAPTLNHVVSDSGRSALDYVHLTLQVVDLVWDATHARIHLATRPDSPTLPGQLVSLDPSTQQVMATAPLRGTPWTLAMSADGQWLYVGYSDGTGLQRLRAADLQTDWVAATGTAHAAITAVLPSPTSPRTVAVFDSDSINFSDFQRLQIFDDGVARPAAVATGRNMGADTIYDLRWAPDGSALSVWASPVPVSVEVTASGLGAWRYQALGGAGHLIGRRAFSPDGRVFDLDRPDQLAGTLGDIGSGERNRDEIAGSGKSFASRTHLIGSYVDGVEISSYDLDHYGFIDNIVFNGVADPGYPGGKLITWGTNGLAVGGVHGLLVARGSFAGPGGATPLSQPMATVGHGSTNSGDGDQAVAEIGKVLGSLSLRVANVYANDIAADRCGHLYAAVMARAPAHANRVLHLDATTLAVLGSGWAGSDPKLLAVADDCSTLYATQARVNAVLRLSAPGLQQEAEIPLGVDSNALVYAQALAVAPGSPNTVAVALTDQPFCGSWNRGIAVFDGTTERRRRHVDAAPYGTRNVTWGADANTLYGADASHIYVMAVGVDGVHEPALLFDRTLAFGDSFLPRDLLYSPARRQLVDPLGNIFDLGEPNTPPRRLDTSRGAVGYCGMPLQAQAVDASSGRIFFAASEGAASHLVDDTRLVITSHDPATGKREQVAKVRMLDLGLQPLSYPSRLVRTGPDRLVLLTDSGQLVALQGPMLSP